jgi:hypothetical protein
VVILEGDRPLADWGQPRGTMAPALIQQLAAADRREGTWSVSLRDVGTAFTGVASVGYMLWIAPMQRPDRPLIEGVARVQYASPDDARRAEEGAAAFAREIVGPEDPGVSFEIRLTGAVLMVVFRGTPNADITALTAWFERTQAAMRTRLDAGPPG